MLSQKYASQLENFRNKIDEIDENLIRLLLERMEIVGQVGELKKTNDEKFFIKSAREADMLRKLIGRSSNKLAKTTIFSIWRKIITNSNQIEQPISIALHNPKNSCEPKYLIRDFYNEQVPIISFDSAWNVVLEVEKENCQIAVFELPNSESKNLDKIKDNLEAQKKHDDWWISLANNQIGLQIFLKFPFFKNESNEQDNGISLVAAAIKPAEKSEADCSLLVVELSGEVSQVQLLSAFKASNLSAKILKTANLNQLKSVNFFLVEIDEFIDEQDLKFKEFTTSKIKPFSRIIGHFPKEVS